jgi:protease IV
MAMSKTSKILLVVGGLLAALLFLGVIGLIVAITTMNKPSVEANSVLVLNVSGPLPDYSAEDPLARAFGIGQPPSLTNLMTQLRKAKVDDRISGVILDINFPQIGWGKADELRDAITDFKGSQKPIYAVMDIGTNLEYYIATAADKIYLPPPGDLYINGFAAQASFYKGSLDKLGVEADVIQIGPKYKSAPDRFTRKEMSDGQREVINAILDEYFSRMTNAIATSRNKSPEDVRSIIDNAPYNAVEASAMGLIDGALYREQVEEDLKAKLGYADDQKLKTIRGSKYREITSDSLGLNSGEKVAVIFASGAINTGRSGSGPLSGEMAGSDTVVSAVNAAAEDTSVKAIVLRVDSPGGSALASDLMWYALENAKAKKPVVVSMSDFAASGGYYIACNANKIVAQPSTLTGSIGVFLGKPVIKGLYDWLGVTNEYVMRGKNAGIFRETEKWTDDERSKMSGQADKIYYDMFLPKVAAGRSKTTEEIDRIAQGRVWTGTQAKENGLIDEFGGLERAIDIAKELAGLPADKDVRRMVFPEPRPFLEEFFSSDTGADLKAEKVIADKLPADVLRLFRYNRLFEGMSRGEAFLMMPFELEIK